MLIRPIDLQERPLEFEEQIVAGSIRYADDTEQLGPMPVAGRADLLVEHRGPQEIVEDIRVRAGFEGRFQVLCARCLDPVEVPLAGRFDLLFRPAEADSEAGERAITEDETEIGYYGKSGLELDDVVREQVLLNLPGRTLCQEDCRGLCAGCGQNLNHGACQCSSERRDGRWSALEGLALLSKQ